MRKVCEVYLVSSSATDERGVELTFPVSQYEMMDAFEQIHTKSPMNEERFATGNEEDPIGHQPGLCRKPIRYVGACGRRQNEP